VPKPLNYRSGVTIMACFLIIVDLENHCKKIKGELICP
jgi:hypothetical protein